MTNFDDLKVGTSIKHKDDNYHICWIIEVLKSGEYLCDTGVKHLLIAPGDITSVDFTLADSLEIQEQQLAQWMTVLKPEVWREMRDAAKASNEGVVNPHKIKRGTSLDSWVLNYSGGYRPF